MEFIEQASLIIIRPNRQNYCSFDLGSIILKNKSKRIDFKITNKKGILIHTSLYIPLAPLKQCVVYCHSSNGSRLQGMLNNYKAISYSEQITNQSKYYCIFDFSGSGVSQGEYISLGYHESQDIFSVLNFLQQKYCINEFSLWGRSMGCMAIMMFTSKLIKNIYPQNLMKKIKISSIILDSPYSNLYDLILQLGQYKTGIPSYILKILFVFIKKTVEQKVDFKIQDLDASKLIGSFKIPLMILCSRKDLIVNNKHSEFIYQKYNHFEKTLYYIDGNHNQQRNSSTNSQIYKFIHTNFRKSQAQQFHIKRKMSLGVFQNKRNEKQNIYNPQLEFRKTLGCFKDKKSLRNRNVQLRGISSILCQKKII